MAGISHPEKVRSFLEMLKRRIENDDREKLASLIKYPLNLYDKGRVQRTYPDQISLLSDYDQIFTAKVRTAIINARYGNLFVNFQGVMIGNGELWFDG